MTFKAFYSRFPRRVKPFNAERAYDKAMLVATHEEVMEGLERFIQAEPWHGEIKFCPHAASWLNSGEWLNEYPEERPEFFTYEQRRLHSQKVIAEAKADGTYPRVVK
ncbi:hypothetical protein LCGC14_2451810 [marine sediment metagenome]|uniref:Uncharacterized protein n=1 Tax=marine sediment metagenome TaxID=412755 RepID=A0A0F9DT11_9ZZZZ